jgi:hypothetical protein
MSAVHADSRPRDCADAGVGRRRSPVGTNSGYALRRFATIGIAQSRKIVNSRTVKLRLLDRLLKQRESRQTNAIREEVVDSFPGSVFKSTSRTRATDAGLSHGENRHSRIAAAFSFSTLPIGVAGNRHGTTITQPWASPLIVTLSEAFARPRSTRAGSTKRTARKHERTL